MNAKPICVVKIDMSADFGGGTKPSLYNLYDAVNGKIGDEYHVFVIPAKIDYENSVEPITFEVFYEKDFTEIQYQELKKIITDSIQQVQEKQN